MYLRPTFSLVGSLSMFVLDHVGDAGHSYMRRDFLLALVDMHTLVLEHVCFMCMSVPDSYHYRNI